MNIVYLIERIDITGGIERSLTARVNYLIKKFNYKITIVCSEKNSGIPAYILDEKVNVIFLEKLTTRKTFFDRIYLRYEQAKSIINDLKPNIIISTKYTLHNFFFQFLRTKNIKLISEMRESKENYDENNFKSIKSWINAKVRNYILRKQDVMIVLTEADKQNWGYNNCIVVANPQTIQTNKVSTLMEKQVLAIGRLSKVKGFDKLLDAWKIVINKHPSWKLKICGKGEEYHNLIIKIKELGIKDSVILPNRNLDVVHEFLESSIFVLTSQFEAFGNVLVEAKVCGLPAISFDAPNGPREIIIEGNDGFVVPINNIHTLARKINYLIDNPGKRKLMGKNAKLNSHKYNIQSIVEKYNTVITNFR